MESDTMFGDSASQATGVKSLITFFVLSLASVNGFMSRLYSVIRYESIIHEFDPWFNYRATKHMTDNGFYDFLNWFDERAWYPLGRIVGGTVYPGLMVTSGFIHYVLHLLNIPIHIREICVFLAPLFSGLTAVATYLLTKELWNARAGLLAACFIAIVPGYISRSVAGSYDNEGIAIFALMFTYFLWIKAVKTGSIMWGSFTAISYFYMVSAWGGYVFIINMIPLHVFVLVLSGRFSNRIYVAYCSFYVIALIIAMQIPFVGFQPVRTSEHMAAAGVFLLLQAYLAINFIRSYLTPGQFKIFFLIAFLVAAGLITVLVIGATYLGYIAPWTGRFYSLWDTGYAKIHIPIIASVSEHQPTTWVYFFFDLHVLILMFPAGVYFCIKNMNDERLFIVLYAAFASYFAGVMVRLMLTLSPCVCVLAAIAFSKLLDQYLKDSPTPPEVYNSSGSDAGGSGQKQSFDSVQKHHSAGIRKRGEQQQAATPSAEPSTNGNDDTGLGTNMKFIIVGMMFFSLMYFVLHCSWITGSAYSSPSIILAGHHNDGSRWIIDDFREAYYWLSQNTDDKARVMSWWDYGYQIAGMGNRTTLVDNNTWNNSHIALVGKAMASNEANAYKIMRKLDVNYVLVIFGGLIGYSGDDINKFLWMVRIAEGEHPDEIRESDYFTSRGEYKIDSEAPKTMLDSLMYKLSYWQFGQMSNSMQTPPGFDATRQTEIGRKRYSLRHMEEAYTSQHWLVRIFKVKPFPNRKRVKPSAVSGGRRPVKTIKATKTRGDRSGRLGVKATGKIEKGSQPTRALNFAA